MSRPARRAAVLLALAVGGASAATAAAPCGPVEWAHGLSQAPDPAALAVLVAAQGPGWQLTSQRVSAPGCASPVLPDRRTRRSATGSALPRPLDPVDAGLHALLGWGRPALPAGPVSAARLAAARAALCAAPAWGGAGVCGAPPVHRPVPSPWPAAPPALIQVDLPGAAWAELQAHVPLGPAGPQPAAVAAHRLALAYSGPLVQMLREDLGLVYDLGAELVVSPGQQLLRLRMRLAPADAVAAMGRVDALRRRLLDAPVATLGGAAALRGSARALALAETLDRAAPGGGEAAARVAFVGQGDPAAPGWDQAGPWSDTALAAGAAALAAAPWTWTLAGDPDRLHAALSGAGRVPDQRWRP